MKASLWKDSASMKESNLGERAPRTQDSLEFTKGVS